VAEEEEESGPPNERKYCTLAPITIRRLRILAKKGTHGTSVPKVMTALIEAGVRDAIEKHYLSLEDGAEP
jgi:hypothetical protein